MTSITFKLPTELRESLEKAAAKDGRKLSDFIRRHFAQKLPAGTSSTKKQAARKTR